MSHAIRNSNDVEIMENITLVTMRTSNNFKDVMKMPIGVFLSTVKHIRMSDLMKNPEWREAYLKQESIKAIKSGKVIKQTKIDLQGLLALQSQ